MSKPASGLSIEPDPQWEAFAAREPYFAVLTAPRFLRANFTETHQSEFFGSGETLVDWIFRTIELRMVPQFLPMSVLEYGCGPGRLALAFARRIGSVTAVDRSPTMLDIARREMVGKKGISIDSRTACALAAQIQVIATHIHASRRQSVAIDAIVTNSGAAMWLPSDVPHGGVLLGAHLYDSAGKLLSFDAATARLTDPPREIRPGEQVSVRLTLSPQPIGEYVVELDCVASHVTWFGQAGSPTVRLGLDVKASIDSASTASNVSQ